VCVPPKLGIFVWTFGTKNDPAPVVAKTAGELGIGFVMIKSGEDDAVWDWNFNESIVSQFTAAGVDAYGIVYIQPCNTSARANNIAQQANVPGSKGVILDAEWEWDGTTGEATALCQGIRSKIGSRFLGYNPQFNWPVGGNSENPTPQFFPDYPWQEFDMY